MSAALLLAATLLSAPAEQNYALHFDGTTKKAKKGADGALVVQIQPAEGYKISSEAPLKIQLSSAGLKLKKNALSRDDAEDKKSPAPKLSTSFSAGSEGEQKIEGTATFFVCSEELCERKREQFTVVVDVGP